MRIALLLAAQFVLSASQQEHFLDVRQIVKGTIEAMQRLPEAAIQQQKELNDSSTTKPEDLMSLFKLPADIMKNLAVGAGYLEEPKTSTYRPWIVARDKQQSEDYSSSSWEEVKKKKHHKRPEDDGLVNIKDLFPSLPVAQPQASPSFFSQVQGDTTSIQTQQDPLYRREVGSDGQVRFVPVYPSTPAPVVLPPLSSPSPFVVVTPLTVTAPRRVMSSDPRFEAQTFPPAVNPFQQPTIQQFPPRILPSPQPLPQVAQPMIPQRAAPLPIPQAPKVLASPIAVPNPLPIQGPQQVSPAQVEVRPSEQMPRKPILVQPVIKKETTTLPPLTTPPPTTKSPPKEVHPITKARILSEETSGSTEDDSIVHSEESEPTPLTRKEVISKTALRVRTIEHDAIRRLYSEEEVKPRSLHGKSKKKTNPAKKTKKIKLPPMEDESTTTFSPPMAEKPTPRFEEAMADIERTRIPLKRRRVHASKTYKIGKRKEDRFDEKEKMSAELEKLPSPQSEQEEEEEREEVTATTPKRRSRLWKKQTVRPKSAFTTTETPTTTEEEETTTEEMKKEKKKKRKLVEKKKKAKKLKKRKTTLTLSTPSPLEITPQHCANIRSFARQFGIFDLRQFADKHCQFIENYYPELTCDRVDEYADECQRH